MANDEKRRDGPNARRRQAGAYEPIRGPRLRGPAAPEPPPLPACAPPQAGTDDPALFGEAAEDGLRILAALETMPSLEPDYCDDLAAEEASVTIIECAAPSDVHAGAQGEGSVPAGSLTARLGDAGEAPDIDADEYAAYHGPVEEAVVEIFDGPSSTPAASGPRRRKGLPVAHRFFKALTGGGSG